MAGRPGRYGPNWFYGFGGVWYGASTLQLAKTRAAKLAVKSGQIVNVAHNDGFGNPVPNFRMIPKKK